MARRLRHRWRCAAWAALALAACRADDGGRHDELSRRLDRLEATLERVADDETLQRGQIDQIRLELAGVRAALVTRPPASPPTTVVVAPAPVAPVDSDGIDAGPALSVAMSVESVPTGAEVRVDGRRVGTTPLIFSRPDDATTELLITRAGYRDRALTLEPGAAQRVTVNLVPR